MRVTEVIFPVTHARAYCEAVSSLERRRSALDRLDDGLLVVAALVGVILVFAVIGWIVSTVMFFVKLAVVALFVGLIVRLVVRRR